MPVKSKAMWRALGAKLSRGEISQATFDEMVHGVDYDKLPERIKKKRRVIVRRRKK